MRLHRSNKAPDCCVNHFEKLRVVIVAAHCVDANFGRTLPNRRPETTDEEWHPIGVVLGCLKNTTVFALKFKCPEDQEVIHL